MRKRIVYSIAALSLLVILSSTVTPPAAAAVSLGLKAGMAADYTVTATSLTYNRTHLYVYSVTAPSITLFVFNTRPDGTPDPSSDTHTGDPKYYGGDYMFKWVEVTGVSTGQNLTTHPNLAIVRGSQDMNAAGVTRTVNHANGTSAGFPYVDIYYDQATGIIVKSTIYYAGIAWVNMTLISTNAWSSTGAGIPASTTTLVLVGAAGLGVGLLLGVVIGKHGKRKR